MRGISPVPTYVVMQPTTLCNLDCSYCYLPFRALDKRMPPAVAEAVASSVNRWAVADDRFSVVWHGGEPMAAGRRALAGLVAPFTGGEHHILSIATLSDVAWCDFFLELRIRVSVCVDGPQSLIGHR